MIILVGKTYITASGREVMIREKGANYYMGTFPDGSYDFWHEDGTSETDGELRLLVSKEFADAANHGKAAPAMPSARFRIAWMIGCAIVGMLIAAAVFFLNRPPH